MTRIYLDNAATSWPKPDAVYDAVDRYQRGLGAAVGRGSTRAAVEVQATVDRCRRQIASLLGAESADRVVFGFNGTDVLNVVVRGLLRPGDHVVTSQGEHNSVLRPLRALEEDGVEVTRVTCDGTGRFAASAVVEALRPNTRLVAVQHASNVTGALQPVAEVAEAVESHQALLLVDAAQTAGHLPIDVRAMSIDLLACSGHKGLLGPLGTGVLYVRPGVEEHVAPLRFGGTGTKSEEDVQPTSMPDRYESGNHNAPGLVGLAAALDWIEERGIDALRRHELKLTGRLLDGLHDCDGLRSFGPDAVDDRVGVVSVTADGFDPRELATVLDENFGIETRSGFHCAPGVHRALGTTEVGGTLRLSVGPFNTADHVDAVVATLREVTSL